MTLTEQMRHPNFMHDGRLYLVRCFVCDTERGLENWSPAVATGACAWCGWAQPVADREAEAMGQSTLFEAA
jgi:hypothetical protein